MIKWKQWTNVKVLNAGSGVPLTMFDKPVDNWCPRPTLKRRSWRWPRRCSPCTCSPRSRLPRWRWRSRSTCLRHVEKVQLDRTIGLHQGGCYLVLTHWIRGSSLTSRNSNAFQLLATSNLLDLLAFVNWSTVINPPTKMFTEFFGLQEEKTLIILRDLFQSNFLKKTNKQNLMVLE